MFVALAAIVASTIEPQFLMMPFRDRTPLARGYARLADADWLDYPEFLAGVRAHTQPGDTIAILTPRMHWDGGYSYAFYRASYFLTGRDVMPLVDRDDKPHPENYTAAKYVAVWRASLRPRGTVVWSGNGGTLTRRR